MYRSRTDAAVEGCSFLLKIISADEPSLLILRLSVCGLMLKALYGRHSSQYAFVILLKRGYKSIRE